MPLRILIAEDSETNRLLLSMTMKRLCCDTDIAANGKAALDFFRHNPYDLVFLDLKMPVMDGIAAAREIQKYNKRNTPVYALSGFPDPAAEDLFSSVGIRRCLLKPLDRDKLDSILAECAIEKKENLPAADSPPRKLLPVYARELRSRGGACLEHLKNKEYRALRREGHTIRALAQMLKTPDVEEASALLEQACHDNSPERMTYQAQRMHTICLNAAENIEKQL